MPEAEDRALLEAAAREAGVVAMRYWRKAPKFWDKGLSMIAGFIDELEAMEA